MAHDAHIEKKAYEAHRVACFATPHPVHQQHPPSDGQNSTPTHATPTLSSLLGAPLPPTTPPAPDTSRVIIHFEADAFYAQCEEVADPSLSSQPLGMAS